MEGSALVCDDRDHSRSRPTGPKVLSTGASRIDSHPTSNTAGAAGFVRSAEDRVVAGVAGGLARRLGVDPLLLRIAFVVLSLAGGTGVLLYGLAWVFVPLDDTTVRAPRRAATLQQSAALGLIVLGLLLFLRRLGLWFGDGLVWPVLLAAVGSAIVWLRSDDTDRSRWSRAAGRLPGSARSAAASSPVSPARVVVGTILVATGVAGFLAANEGLTALPELGLAVVAGVVGVALLFGPWLWRLTDQLGVERRERIRQEERAELAAHLHDSVLQTLALIQRSADHPRRMVALARRQERELRSWLYGEQDDLAAPATLDAALEALAEEVEAVHDLTVEVVTVGDTPIDERVRALLAATREACVNAAKHADVTQVAVYVEVEPDTITAFVRDRGVGFDPDAAPADRQGIRESIVGRLRRHGGRADISSSLGAGTEIELSIPRPRHDAGPEA